MKKKDPLDKLFVERIRCAYSKCRKILGYKDHRGHYKFDKKIVHQRGSDKGILSFCNKKHMNLEKCQKNMTKLN